MLLKRIDGLLIDIDEVAALEQLVVRLRRLELHGLLRVLECEIRRVERKARTLPRMLQTAARVEIVSRLQRIAVGRVVVRVLVRLTAHAVHCALPGKRRPRAAARRREIPARLVYLRDGLLDGAVVLERHLDAIVETELHGIRRKRRTGAQRHEACEHKRRELFMETIRFLQSDSSCQILFYQNVCRRPK